MTSLAFLVVLGNQAFAHENAIDVVPAATLLLPHFEVDLANEGGLTTLFSVNNASAAPQLAHVVFWTDQSRPTLDFTIYLTGYDVWTVNLGPLFRQGTIPLLIQPPAIGGPKQMPAGDEDAGDYSATTGPAVTEAESSQCTFPLPTSIPPSFLNFIQRVHTGQTAPAGFEEAGKCGAAIWGDNIARGYMTIDVVRQCDPLTPSAGSSYFNGVAAGGEFDSEYPGTANTIWGDFFLVDPDNNFAQGDTLVHIEAYRDPATTQYTPLSKPYTFYGRYVDWDGSDNREPLATVWGSRYALGGAFDGTDLLCWRDTGTKDSADYYATVQGACAGHPPTSGLGADGQPLGQHQLVIFDEEENPITIEEPPFSPTPVGETLTPCPWESTRVAVGGPTLPTAPFQFGWIYLNLNSDNSLSDRPDEILQSWVGTIFAASGRFSVGLQGVHFDNATDPADICLGPGHGDFDVCGGS